MSVKQFILRFFLRVYTMSRKSRTGRSPAGLLNFMDTTIVITTFEKRFFDFTLPLIDTIRMATNIPIMIVINGNFNLSRDDKKYRDFVVETQKYPNVGVITFSTFRGWSSMVNAGLLHSDSENYLVFNDDIYLNPSGLALEFTNIISEVRNSKLVLINNSWSHFAISRQCLSSIGFFDEHFLGIGQEDGDYALRYHEHFGSEVPSVKVSGIVNFVDTGRDELIAVTNGKYSLFNNVYLEVKLRIMKEFSEAGLSRRTEGSLMSIHFWRFHLYQTLGWDEWIAVYDEIMRNRGLRRPIDSREN